MHLPPGIDSVSRSAQSDASAWREYFCRGNLSRKVMPSQVIDSSS
jgi:hypothetical protein